MTAFNVWAPHAGRVDAEVAGMAVPMSAAAGRPGWWTAEADAPAQRGSKPEALRAASSMGPLETRAYKLEWRASTRFLRRSAEAELPT